MGTHTGERPYVCETAADLTSVIDSGGGAARAEDAQGTPTQSHISPSILVYEDKLILLQLGAPPPVSRHAPPPPTAAPAPAVPRPCKNNCFTETCGGSEAGSYLRLIDS